MRLDRRGFVAGGAVLGAATMNATTAAAADTPRGATRLAAASLGVSEPFFIPAPPERVWRVFNDPVERGKWFGVPGAPSTGGSKKLRLGQWDTTAVDHPGMPGPYQTSVKFDAVPGGTLINHKVTGFGPGPVWENAVQSSVDGIAEMFSDLAIYLRTGVAFPRHTGRAFPNRPPHPNDLRTGTRGIPGGLEVLEVKPGTLAAEAGLQAGDVIVAVGDAGIFGMRDVRMLSLAHSPGDEIEVTWIRNGKLMKGGGRMTQQPIRWRKGFTPLNPG